MKLTPLDIQRHSFQTRYRGADADEVKTFLNKDLYRTRWKNRSHLVLPKKWIATEPNSLSRSIRPVAK